MRKMFSLVSRNFRDNEGASGDQPKTFTQEQVNAFLAEERRKTAAELKKIQDAVGTTEKQKEALQKQIDELKTSYLTKEEQAQEQFKARQTQLETDLAAKTAAATRWQNQYANAVYAQRMTTAAVAKGAFNPELISQLFERDMELIEGVGEDGTPNGVFEPKINFTKLDKNNKPVKLKVTPEEAVELMTKDVAKYGSLFKSTANGGTGDQNSGRGTGKPGSFADAVTSGDHEAARKAYQAEILGK